MIRITDDLYIHEDEVELRFVRASGPGGQHVNKVSTAVQIRFDVESSPNIPPEMKARLRKLAGKKMNEDGVISFEARRYRSQLRNREDALERLVTLLARATKTPKKRVKRRPSAAAKARRLEEKRRRSRLKQERGAVRDDER